VAIRTELPLKIAASSTPGAKKFVFIHTDYKTYVASGEVSASEIYGERDYYDRMDSIFYLTEQNAGAFSEYMPELSPKLKFIKNVNDGDSILRLASAFYPPEYEIDKYIILTVARIELPKGIEVLLKSAHKLKGKGVHFCWFILGYDWLGEYSQKCHKLRESLGLKNEVIFLGERPNPFPYYRHCDLYVQTSLFEGRALAVEEARVLKCPIVTTDYPSAHDQIKDGVDGRICPHDPAAISEVIYELYCDRKELKRLGEANSEYQGDLDKEKYFEYFS
jgi:glycosyltransferase involved in cell wall biosynthesis